MSNAITAQDKLYAYAEANGMLKVIVESFLLEEYPAPPEMAAKVLVKQIEKSDWPIEAMHDLKEKLKQKYNIK